MTRPSGSPLPSIRSLLIAAKPAEVARFLPEALLAQVRALTPACEVMLSPTLDAAALQEALNRLKPEVMVTCWSTPPLPRVFPPELRYVCHLAGSVKRLLGKEHLSNGLLVTNWGSSISRVVAECALMLTIAALRRAGYWIPALHRDGTWKDYDTETGSLFGRRVGLHGFGAVARSLTRLLRPFDVEIGIHAPETDPALYAAHGARRVATLEELFSRHDIIIEVAPLVAETEGIITEHLLRLIPHDGVFVNVGRGPVVDEAALLRVAREGRIQIALDVYDAEPLSPHSGFRGLPNVILLPHLAGPTMDRRRDAGEFCLRNLRSYALDQPLVGVISSDTYDQLS